MDNTNQTAYQNGDFSPLPANLPVTHNHFIGLIPGITLDNTRGVLCLLHRVLRDADGNEVHFSADETEGLECIVKNAIEALRFEQYYRD